MTGFHRPTLRAAAALCCIAFASSAARTQVEQRSTNGDCVGAGSSATVLGDDFESGRGPVYRALAGDPRLSLAEGEGIDGGRALRATYVGGDMGSERLVRSIPLGVSGLEFTLSYDVRFDRDFQFVRGGKLHGLGPVSPVTGGEPLRPDGWSARVMWREGGRAETYVYHQDQRGRYGESARSAQPFAFRPGRYHAVSLHVRLNDPVEEANGFARLYIDGHLVEAQEKLRFRSSGGSESLISRFLFSTFHGGNDPTWAPRSPTGGYANVHAYFDNIAVHAGERIRASSD